MTRKQELFVQEYAVDLRGAAAARRAGYAGKNAAWRLLRNREVKAKVEAVLQEKMDRARIRGEEVLAELKAVAFAQGSDAAGAEVKLGSKLKALELLGKHLGLFEGQGREELRGVEIREDV